MEILISLTPNASEPRSVSLYPKDEGEKATMLGAIGKAIGEGIALDVRVDDRAIIVNPAHIVYVEVPD